MAALKIHETGNLRIRLALSSAPANVNSAKLLRQKRAMIRPGCDRVSAGLVAQSSA
jgi:hypothetical protein